MYALKSAYPTAFYAASLKEPLAWKCLPTAAAVAEVNQKQCFNQTMNERASVFLLLLV